MFERKHQREKRFESYMRPMFWTWQTLSRWIGLLFDVDCALRVSISSWSERSFIICLIRDNKASSIVAFVMAADALSMRFCPVCWSCFRVHSHIISYRQSIKCGIVLDVSLVCFFFVLHFYFYPLYSFNFLCVYDFIFSLWFRFSTTSTVQRWFCFNGFEIKRCAVVNVWDEVGVWWEREWGVERNEWRRVREKEGKIEQDWARRRRSKSE